LVTISIFVEIIKLACWCFANLYSYHRNGSMILSINNFRTELIVLDKQNKSKYLDL
jgi:hypothetical protein